jgi:hypothetical protein
VTPESIPRVLVPRPPSPDPRVLVTPEDARVDRCGVFVVLLLFLSWFFCEVF